MKPKSNPRDHTAAAVDEMLNKLYLQAKAQFGSAIQSFWFHDDDLCPGWAQRSIGAIKFKGKNAPSLNAFIFRERGVLIGYFLCKTCAMPNKRKRSLMDSSSTVTKGIDTLHRRILCLLLSITSLLPCPGVAPAGTMLRWRTSSDISRKKLSDNTNPLLLRRLNRSLTITFASTTTKGYN